MTLLFVHATGFHARVWDPVIAALTAACVAIDQPGHGDAPAPHEPDFDWTILGPAVLDAVDALERPFGVGHSSGATALLMAEQARPGTFAALWLYEPIVVPIEDPLPPTENPLSEGARRRREVFESRDAAYDNFASKPPFSSLDPAALRAYVDYGFDDLDDGSVRLKCRAEIEARYYLTQASHTTFRHLDKVRCPVTLVRGDDPDRVPGSFVVSIAARLASPRIDTIDNADHFGPLQQPAAVATSIINALDLA